MYEEPLLKFDHRFVDDDRVTPGKLELLGFKKDGFNAWNKCISTWPESHLKQLSFSGDYLYLREGRSGMRSKDDDLVTLWNNDVRGVMTVKYLMDLYYILTGSLLQSPNDLPF